MNRVLIERFWLFVLALGLCTGVLTAEAIDEELAPPEKTAAITAPATVTAARVPSESVTRAN